MHFQLQVQGLHLNDFASLNVQVSNVLMYAHMYTTLKCSYQGSTT